MGKDLMVYLGTTGMSEEWTTFCMLLLVAGGTLLGLKLFFKMVDAVTGIKI